MDRFDELAAGASELHVQVQKGDIAVRVAEGSGWTLEYSSGRDEAPEVERDGSIIRVRQHGNGFPQRRMDVRLTLPRGVEGVELRTGMGKIDAEGIRGRLRLNSGNGAVTVRAAGGEAEVSSGNGNVDIEGYQGAITASTGNGRTRIASLDGQASLRTGNGRVEVLDSDGQVRAVTGNGNVVFTRVGGMVEADSGHGGIEIDDPRALDARVTTAMGSIRVADGSLRNTRLKSMMGEMSCSAALMAGKHDMETAMGSITVDIPAAPAVRVEAQTSFGQVHSDFPLVRVGRSGPMGFGGVRMVGSIGDGDAEIDLSLRTTKGGITLRRSSRRAARSTGATSEEWGAPEAPAPPFGPPEPPFGSPDMPSPPAPPMATTPPTRLSSTSPTLAILEALSRGEISPAEAEDLLLRQG